MTTEAQAIDWQAIGQQLAAPFAPETVQWRTQGKPAPNANVQIVAYIDARDVMDRLDAVVGPGGWSFALEPVLVTATAMTVARGRLSIHGVAKDDVGEASSFDPSKGCASDALKRAAVMWGIARYLYSLPAQWVMLDGKGKIPQAELDKRIAALRRKFGEGLAA